mmetsp:Transcript_17358/g.22135  ORF Transcript_17358/g.22135 Transcript_17358/m.22135 type:complete len:445 (+) Transcript_17358:70-1404(+)|eukprot:CAMPEP_0204869322 /NCGR_PEP_ID=MMETSP1348-20121228/29260_1 /ASSEMBLY_ACC=CAM_ASM_000700 /TAXON_ID=215587 /ORGANISM="Aplanochytrium stocchinoi, Strain GSBS06" /LENGTH=444 /DNA_ID=CAMNT_0052022637 /DNA_START=50 /DNA_END=1384 /DNA_ORIENTATION=+
MGEQRHHRRKPTLVVVVLGSSGRRVDIDDVLELPIDVVVLAFANTKVSTSWKKEILDRIEIPALTDACHESVKKYKEALNEAAFQSLMAWSNERNRDFDGITCFDDQGVELVAYLCETLKLPGTSQETIDYFQDKLRFRMFCLERGLPSVLCKSVDNINDIHDVLQKKDWPYPSILKPRKGAGSVSVRKVQNPAQLIEEYNCVVQELKNSTAPDFVKMSGFVLEEYFEGEEVDIDGWVSNGQLCFQLVSDNNPALEPYFLEMGGTYPSQLPALAIDKFEKMTQNFFQVFSDFHGCFVLEAKINLQTMNIQLIEMNSRVSGAEAPFSFKAVTGHSLLRIAAHLALNIPYEIEAGTTSIKRVVCSANLYGSPTKYKKKFRGAKGNGDYIFSTKTNKAGNVGLMYFNEGGTIKDKELRERNFIGWVASASSSYDDAMKNLVATKRHL